MKNRILPFVACAAIIASIPFWQTEAFAQPGSTSTGPKLPINKSVIVTLDPKSDSRSELTKETRRYSGFTNQNTVEGVLIHMDTQWLVLKGTTGTDESWIPRDKVLLLHSNR